MSFLLSINKANIVDCSILPNIFCCVKYNSQIKKTKTAYGVSQTDFSANFCFEKQNSYQIRFQIYHKKQTNTSFSGESKIGINQNTEQIILLCMKQQNINQIYQKKLIKLRAVSEFCRGGLLQVVKQEIKSKIKNNIFDISVNEQNKSNTKLSDSKTNSKINYSEEQNFKFSYNNKNNNFNNKVSTELMESKHQPLINSSLNYSQEENIRFQIDCIEKTLQSKKSITNSHASLNNQKSNRNSFPINNMKTIHQQNDKKQSRLYKSPSYQKKALLQQQMTPKHKNKKQLQNSLEQQKIQSIDEQDLRFQIKKQNSNTSPKKKTSFGEYIQNQNNIYKRDPSNYEIKINHPQDTKATSNEEQYISDFKEYSSKQKNIKSYLRLKNKKQKFKKSPYSINFVTQADESSYVNQKALLTQSPYQTGEENRDYLSNQYSKIEPNEIKVISRKKLKGTQIKPITHKNDTLCITNILCNMYYLKHKNFKDKLSIVIILNDEIVYQTKFCKQKYTPYKWEDQNIKISAFFNKIKFIVKYRSKSKSSNEIEIEQQENYNKNYVQIQEIGQAVYESYGEDKNMVFTIPVKYNNIKCGELSFKLSNIIAHQQKQQKQQKKQKYILDQNILQKQLQKIQRSSKKQNQIKNLIVNNIQKQNLFKNQFKKNDLSEDQNLTKLSKSKTLQNSPHKTPEIINNQIKQLQQSQNKYDFYKKIKKQKFGTIQYDLNFIQKDNSINKFHSQSDQSLIFHTIIFKNFDKISPTTQTFLLIKYDNFQIKTQEICQKQILWTKQIIKSPCFKLSKDVQFKVYFKNQDQAVLLGQNLVNLSQLQSRRRVYSYKIGLYSDIEHKQVVGQLLINYEFLTNTINSQNSSDFKFMDQKPSRKISLDSQKIIRKRSKNINSILKSKNQRYLNQRYSEVISRHQSISHSKAKNRNFRQPFYYAGKNIKFSQADRFQMQNLQNSVRASPGPGSYLLPSIFDRHKLME